MVGSPLTLEMFFFFSSRRRHTRYWRDWSSDVCSSDLDVARFLDAVGKPLRAITLGDLQRFADSLSELAPTSQARMLSSVKSLLTFAQKAGYLHFNPGAALILPKAKNTMGERILSEQRSEERRVGK